MARLIQFLRDRSPATIAFHSCGSVYALIPDFIDVGVQVLNPVQVAAADMDTARLRREFGKHLVFWGAIDTQRVLPRARRTKSAPRSRGASATCAPATSRRPSTTSRPRFLLRTSWRCSKR